MNIKSLIFAESAKRRERMLDAVSKGRFRIRSRLAYRDGGKTVTLWEVWSSHTHRRNPRLYTVSQVGERGIVRWGCTCPDFETNGQWFPCKHILYVQTLGEG